MLLLVNDYVQLGMQIPSCLLAPRHAFAAKTAP